MTKFTPGSQLCFLIPYWWTSKRKRRGKEEGKWQGLDVLNHLKGKFMFKAPVFHRHWFAPFLCLNSDFPLYKNRQYTQYTHSAYIWTEVPLKLSSINKTKLFSIFFLVIILFPDYVLGLTFKFTLVTLWSSEIFIFNESIIVVCLHIIFLPTQ